LLFAFIINLGGVRSCFLPLLLQTQFNEILMLMHAIFKTGKKQDLTPQAKGVDFFILG
jgi:hypothetical protein